MSRPEKLRVTGAAYRPGRVTLTADAADGTRYEVQWDMPRFKLLGVVHALTQPDAPPDPYRGARRLPRPVIDGG